MLQQLSIKNFATVDKLLIEFESGMTVITGETGAGKSIILGALGLALGDRADKTVIRAGADRAEVIAEFDTRPITVARRWLVENELDEAEQDRCILRRVVNADGRSKAYINDTPVTMANLQVLGEMLLDIHSQHEHQSLLHRGTHLRLLDEFGVKPALLRELSDVYQKWQANHASLQSLQERSDESAARNQLLKYQLQELEELGLGENEAELLEQEQRQLSNADGTLASVSKAVEALSENDDGSVLSGLDQVRRALSEIKAPATTVSNSLQLVENAALQLDEASHDLRSFLDNFDANPERLEQVNSRMGQLHDMARKHRIKPAMLSQLISDLRQQLGDYENNDLRVEQLQAEDQVLRHKYHEIAVELSTQRKQAAKKLGRQINQQLQTLGMVHARLEIALKSIAQDDPTSFGAEQAEFLVSTNPGQPPRPLAKIASGGELSRISLAIQVITAATSQIPSLVFDEVDVGIGGGVAKIVGELLRKLGGSTQVICVTHQAQVASQGHHHYRVSKQSTKSGSQTRIARLSDSEKVEEVARMLSGEDYSHESLAHAEQLVAGQS
ncbi:MAG: DNA repair protein RecN [Gammaproteobacteria bacterium]